MHKALDSCSSTTKTLKPKKQNPNSNNKKHLKIYVDACVHIYTHVLQLKGHFRYLSARADKDYKIVAVFLSMILAQMKLPV
jgi:hypothetical protein